MFSDDRIGISKLGTFEYQQQLWGIYSTKLFHQFKFKPRTPLGTLGQNKWYVYFGTRGRVRFLYTGEIFSSPAGGEQKFYFLALVWCLGRLSPSDVLSIKNSGLNHYNVVKPEMHPIVKLSHISIHEMTKRIERMKSINGTGRCHIW